MQRVLNVGGNSKSIEIPAHYRGWQHDLLDIDPAGNPDIVADARELDRLPGGTYDAVYCSHNLEHYYLPEARKVLRGFDHVLRDDGFVELHVPDIEQLIRFAADKRLGLDDVAYHAGKNPITVRDMIYGHQPHIERGNTSWAHHNAWTVKSLARALSGTRLEYMIHFSRRPLELSAYVFKQPPSLRQRELLELDKLSEISQALKSWCKEGNQST
jgi:SAM-dependent methyltransferase